MTPFRRILVTTAVIALVATWLLATPPSPAHAASRLEPGQFASDAIGGPVDYTVYLPDGYDPAAATRYPTVYLLHGRGDTQAAWQQVADDLDELIAAGEIPPVIAVMPDAPWSNRGNYYVDSLYTGDDPATTPGVAVETAFTSELVQHIDQQYRTVADRAARAVAGYSMGGAGALRYVTARQDVFSAAIVLSPAVYVPATPVGGSSTQEFGAYGVGDVLFVPERYDELNYPAGFAALDPALPVHLFIAVGDDEYANPDPRDAIHDLDYEAATLYNAARRVPGATAELRVYDGGHDWGVWERGFREGMIDLAGYLRTSPPTPITGTLSGTAGQDYAGGVHAEADGTVVQVVNAAGQLWGESGAGGLDIVVEARDGDREWTTSIGGPANDRAYGIVAGVDGGSIIAGYTRGDLDGNHPADNDDALVVGLDADGNQRFLTQFGSTSAADRIYAIAADGQGGAYVAGYTSGSLPDATNAGDKDAFVARIGADGSVSWLRQLGGTGEDKALAVAATADGVLVGGLTGATMPSATSSGDYDGWVASFGGEGTQRWLTQLGTGEFDQVAGLAIDADGVIAVGHTGGTLGARSAGGNDAFVARLGADGALTWVTQDGTSGDDRAAAVVPGADGYLVVGHTDGRMGTSSGGVDVFTMTVDDAGSVGSRSQFGTDARDGADEWDEANLFASSDGASSAWIQGITFGSLPSAGNAGSSDVFLTEVPWEGADASDGDSDDGAAAGSGFLGFTGEGAPRLAAAAALFVLALGAAVLAVRRSTRQRA